MLKQYIVPLTSKLSEEFNIVGDVQTDEDLVFNLERRIKKIQTDLATIQIKAKRLDLESSDTLSNLYQEVLDQIRIELKSVTNQQMANEKGIHAVIKNRAKLQKEEFKHRLGCVSVKG